jgi:hypothetical protein
VKEPGPFHIRRPSFRDRYVVCVDKRRNSTNVQLNLKNARRIEKQKLPSVNLKTGRKRFEGYVRRAVR